MRSFPSRKTTYSSSRDRLALLSNPSPPPSPSPFVTAADPNVGTLFPSVHGATESFDDATMSGTSKKVSQLLQSYQSTPEKVLPQNPREENSPSSGGALQFVPAYEEATSPAMTNNPSTSPDTSWDAIASPTDVKRRSPPQSLVGGSNSEAGGMFRRKSSNQQLHSAVSFKSVPVTPSPIKSVVSNNTNNAIPAFPKRNKTTKPDDTVSSVSNMSSRTKGSRIARLASLFSSRAVVKNMDADDELKREEGKQTALTPASPPRSDASSNGYVGWPGTQDKRGGTVAIQSSYEDSDIAPPSKASTRRKYNEEVEEAVHKEISSWMDTDEPSSYSGESPEKNPRAELEPRSTHLIEDDTFNRKATPAKMEERHAADFHLAAVVADAE